MGSNFKFVYENGEKKKEIPIEKILGFFKGPKMDNGRLEIGEWSLQELIKAKDELEDLIFEQVTAKLSKRETEIYNKIQMIRLSNESDLRKQLTSDEKEIFDKYFATNSDIEIVDEGELEEEEALELLEMLEEEGEPLNHKTEDLEKEIESLTDAESKNDKVIKGDFG